ncbi:hypothetical protein [Flavivirga jejuensis]|uniref:SPW repeat-containing protein n=1 Tax=Flavivirga jejuensis TaxID=870487 RepID=A0ABT8WMZ3_9FLAO|nr:hypothetical protein [Flavivirga jejuensis]MDO5974527.1 hypothetical protein [Flavivirga jejuensis]
MSRLFYEKTKTTIQYGNSSLDEIEEETFGEVKTVSNKKDTEGSENENRVNGYLEKISRLIPSEIIAGYLAMFGFVPLIEKEDVRGYVIWIIFIMCLILTPIYLNKQAEKGKPKINHLLVSSLAFIIWAYVTTGMKLVPELYDAAAASIVLVAFSLISAVVPLNK